MAKDVSEDLVNPYGNGTRRRFTLGGASVLRRVALLVALVVSVVLVGVTVATSCAPPPAVQQDVTGPPGG